MTRPSLLIASQVTPRMEARLAEGYTLHQLPVDAGQRETFLAARGRSIEAAICYGGDRFSSDLIAALPALRMISNYGVGYDGIDIPAAVARGIMVSHTPDVLNDEVANTAILLWLATARRLSAYDAYVRAGRWEREGNPPLTRTTQGQTVGIVGLGRIGQAIADRLGVFGAEVLYHARTERDVPYRYFPDLAEMARAADALIVITPGGSETRHLIDAKVIEALGPEGILVNVARGSVVDEAALVAALQEGRLGGAGLDVFEDEPRVPEALFAMENVVLQPHVGSATHATRAAMGDLVCDNLDAFFATGRPHAPVPECREMAEGGAA